MCENLCHFSTAYENNATSPPGFLGFHPFIWRLSFSIDVILSDIANAFQIWLTPAIYEELAGGIWANHKKKSI